MHGLYLLWWVREKQLSPALVASMMALGDLAVMLLEVPTGWLADRLGHRVSLVAGSIVQVVGMLACWLCPGLLSLVAGCLVIALGDALRSGADQALLYRSCVADDAEEEFQSLEARAHAISVSALVGLVLLGGAVTEAAGFHIAWALESLLCALGVVLAWSMREPPAFAAPAHCERSKAASGGRSHRMIAILLPAAIISACAAAAAFAFQVQDAIAPLDVAMMVAVITALEAAGALLGGRRAALRPRQQWLLAAAAAGAAVTTAWRVTEPFAAGAGFVVAALLAAADGMMQPWRAAAIQRLAADDARARAASLASACDMACSSLLLPLTGWVRARRR